VSVSSTASRRLDASRSSPSLDPVKLAYIFTTFPKLTETFLQREIRAMRRLPVELELFSLWGGEAQFEGLAVRRFSKVKLLTLLWWLPYWMARKPRAIAAMVGGLLGRPPPSWKNLGETLVGIGFAVTHARRISKPEHRPDLIHAAWATMPATAAQLLEKLTGIPFTMGAHAYDVYQHGGDWLLPGKLRDAARIVTSTQMARSELLRRGADAAKVVLVRRGLLPFPALNPPRPVRTPLRILSVARLVEKKGLLDQLSIFSEMKHRNIAFEARVVGDGPLAKIARARTESLGLSESVGFAGSLDFAGVLEQFVWADVLVFTGSVARDGDRDGLPNVILEAMATGTPVVARRSDAIAELLRDGENATLLSDADPEKWIRALVRLRDDDVHYGRIRQAGRATAEAHADARTNTEALFAHLGAVADR
jgi:glycosyltransferase involved in cell wall biosynthesis